MYSFLSLSTAVSCGWRRRIISIKGDSFSPAIPLAGGFTVSPNAPGITALFFYSIPRSRMGKYMREQLTTCAQHKKTIGVTWITHPLFSLIQHPSLATFCVCVVHILLVQLLDFFLLEFFKLIYVTIYAFNQFIKVGIRTFSDKYTWNKTLVLNYQWFPIDEGGSLLRRQAHRKLLLEGIWILHCGHCFFPTLKHFSMQSRQNLCRHSLTIRVFLM